MDYNLRLINPRTAGLSLKDRITVYQLQSFKGLLGEVNKKIGNRKRLILDFSTLTFMDPLALGVIVAFSKEFREKGGEIKIVNVNGDLSQVFEESRLARVYETYASIDEAERAFA